MRVVLAPRRRTDAVVSSYAHRRQRDERGARGAVGGLGGAELVRVLDRLAAAKVSATPQDEAHVTYAARLTRHDGVVQWDRPAVELHNQIRGLHPWPLAESSLEGRPRAPPPIGNRELRCAVRFAARRHL